MYRPVASTLIRSVVPAPINTVFVNVLLPGKDPITVLLAPVVIRHPAHAPIPIFVLAKLLVKDKQPIAILLPPTIFLRREN